MGNSSNKITTGTLFNTIYGNIQAELWNNYLSAEEKLLYMYQEAYESIMKDIAGIYERYSVNGTLTHAEMTRYNRLKNLEKQVSDKLLPQLRKKDEYLKKHVALMYEESFFKHGYAIDQDAGAALSWGTLREEDIESVVQSPLGKLSESKVLKGDRDLAVFSIRKEITLGLVRGDAYPVMARRIRDVIGLQATAAGFIPSEKGLLYKALRIARTEGQRAVVEGQQKAYQKAQANGVELEEVWDAALDSRTRPEHGALDGKVKQELGWYVPSIGYVTAPLQSGVASFDIHCRCRIRGQIKGYPPKTRGQKGLGQQPWTDYETWEKAVKEKGSAKNLKVPPKPKISDIATGRNGAMEFGSRLRETDSHVGGSTGAKVYIDDEGQEWIVKNYRGSEEKVCNEYIANKLYQKAGVQVADTRLAYIDDVLSIASRRLTSDFVTVGNSGLSKACTASRIRTGFVTDAWLANWDVAGLGIDNIMWSKGNVSSITRIDHGGALMYRAQGASKGKAFGKEVTELLTLRDPKINYASSKLFANVTDDDIAKQIRTLKGRLKKSDINDILSDSGLHSDVLDQYFDILTSRFDYLQTWEKNFSKKVVSKPHVNVLMGHSPNEVTRMVQNAWGTFTETEKQAIIDFTGSGYRRINREALKGKYYKELDDAIDKFPYYEGVVGRGVSSVPNIGTMFEKWKSGEWARVEWNAYSSTSMTPGRSFDTSDGMLMVIKTNGKNRAGYINGKSKYASEDEYLFAPKAQFRVVGYAESPDRKKRTLLLEETQELIESQEPPKRMEYEEILQIWKDSRAR